MRLEISCSLIELLETYLAIIYLKLILFFVRSRRGPEQPLIFRWRMEAAYWSARAR